MTDPSADDRWAKVLLDHLEEGFALHGRTGEILAANPAAARILGLSLDELTGRTSTDPRWRAVHEDGTEWPGDTHPAMEALRTGRAVPAALMGVHRPDARLVWIEVRATPLPVGADGRPSGVVASFRDVTESRETSEAVALTRYLLVSDARDRAEASAAATSEFLATLSHGIRTPITGIVGLVDVLLPRLPDDELRQLVLDVRAAADGLSVAVADVLDVVRLDAGDLEVRREAFDLLGVLERGVGVLAHAAAERGVTLTAECAPDVPGLVVGDRSRIGQVVVHLVEDAVGAASGGAVTVRASLAHGPGGDDDEGVALVVTGPGDLPDAGLGLAIARRLVDVMGGDLRLERSLGGGTSAVVTLSLPTAGGSDLGRDDGSRRRGDEASFAGGRVLLAEDSAVNREVLARMLGMLGLLCDSVENGEHALRAALSASYDAVLMDVNMPQMDGLEATRALRADPRGARVPVIALTAASSLEDERGCRAAGMDGFVAKPVSLDDLRVALSPYFRPGAALELRRLEVLAEKTGSDEVVVEVVAMFVDELEGRRERLRAAVAGADREQVRLEAHTLGSTADMLGAVRLGRRCRELELGAPDAAAEWLADAVTAVDAALAVSAEGLSAWLAEVRQAGSKR